MASSSPVQRWNENCSNKVRYQQYWILLHMLDRKRTVGNGTPMTLLKQNLFQVFQRYCEITVIREVTPKKDIQEHQNGWNMEKTARINKTEQKRKTTTVIEDMDQRNE